MLNHTLRSSISQGTDLFLVTQLFSLESHRKKICVGSYGMSMGWQKSRILNFWLCPHETRQFPAERRWSAACQWIFLFGNPSEAGGKTPSKGWILKGPRHGISVNTRHCTVRLSPHFFCLPGLLHHCYHCSDFHSSIVSIWRFDNFFKCWVIDSPC